MAEVVVFRWERLSRFSLYNTMIIHYVVVNETKIILLSPIISL